jgi:(p)ppGpp synthase/HD superfamily hydrolase
MNDRGAFRETFARQALPMVWDFAESNPFVHQRRKGASQEPYINHLLEVAMLVAMATEGKDPNLVIAALLHDAIEDQGITREEIAARFGAAVADLVTEVTDDKSLPKAERKRLQIVHAPGKSHRAKILKLADKTSNLRAIAASPPADWNAERRLVPRCRLAGIAKCDRNDGDLPAIVEKCARET